jgi:hypothetical protein
VRVTISPSRPGKTSVDTGETRHVHDGNTAGERRGLVEGEPVKFSKEQTTADNCVIGEFGCKVRWLMSSAGMTCAEDPSRLQDGDDEQRAVTGRGRSWCWWVVVVVVLAAAAAAAAAVAVIKLQSKHIRRSRIIASCGCSYRLRDWLMLISQYTICTTHSTSTTIPAATASKQISNKIGIP